MRNWEEFEAMLCDPSHIDHSMKVNKDLSDAMNSVEGLDEFSQRAEAAGRDETEIFRLVREFYTLDKIREMMRHERAAFSRTPTFGSALSGNSTPSQALMVVARTRYFLSLVTALDAHMLGWAKRQHSEEPKQVGFPSGHAELVVLKGELRCRVWRVNPFDDTTDLRSYRAEAHAEEPIVMREGDRLRQRDFESLEFLEHHTSALFLNTQMIGGLPPLDLYCDVASGDLRSTSAPDSNSSRFQMMATLLRLQGRKDGFEAVADLLEDRHHYVRWHAMRELIGLDADRAYPELKKLAESDAQPSVRRAALATLELVYNEKAAQAA